VPGQHVALDDPGIARSAVEGDAPRHLERSEGRAGDDQGDERPPVAGAESDDESGRQRGRDAYTANGERSLWIAKSRTPAGTAVGSRQR
jgi:hypothetical protein